MESRPANDVSPGLLASLFNSAYSVYPSGSPGFDAETMTAWLSRNRISLQRSHVFYSADGVDEALGIALVARRSDKPTHSRLAMIGIIPTAQGHGYGSEGVDLVISAERASGTEILELECLVNDTKALTMYQRRRFQAVLEMPEWESEVIDQMEWHEDPGRATLKETTVDEVERIIEEHGDKERLPWQAYMLSSQRSAKRAFRLGHAYCAISDPDEEESGEPVSLASLIVEEECRGQGQAWDLIRCVLSRYKGRRWSVPGVFPRSGLLGRLPGDETDHGQVLMRLKLNGSGG
ncbi:uncharacterized protein J7T54_006844 [Emericellopsis cladophorae]|uniref:N-acetyltransferase domain-containing protein n=1 Tax=Emericellopsis cladophorae TaxID=2686198 RepID=A0A9P9Y7Z4_9HYPO|nr:uncharacterized protein J7T54_006844 [Emericellopsis cladophorae]KAI6785202.1 hypothetical protein J7T54_006844 [Emericellopsis cladophorae]